jgi:DNA-binding transcriptional LysR family regulator
VLWSASGQARAAVRRHRQDHAAFLIPQLGQGTNVTTREITDSSDIHLCHCRGGQHGGGDVPTRWELGGHVVEPKAVLSTNDYHHLCSRALGGDVVTELPPFLAAAHIGEKRLVPLLPQYPLTEWSINLLYLPHRYPSTIVRTYLDFCQSYLPKIAQACEIGVVG